VLGNDQNGINREIQGDSEVRQSEHK